MRRLVLHVRAYMHLMLPHVPGFCLLNRISYKALATSAYLLYKLFIFLLRGRSVKIREVVPSRHTLTIRVPN